MLSITPWERSALQLLADGRAPHEVALRLSTTEQEVELRLATLFARMGAANQSEAVATAFRRGLVSL